MPQQADVLMSCHLLHGILAACVPARMLCVTQVSAGRHCCTGEHRYVQPDRIRKSSTPFLSASSNSQRYWRTASAVPWNQREPVGLWLAARTSTKPFELYPPTFEFCGMQQSLSNLLHQHTAANAHTACCTRFCINYWLRIHAYSWCPVAIMASYYDALSY